LQKDSLVISPSAISVHSTKLKCKIAPNLALYSLQSDKRDHALSEGGHVFTNPDIMISRVRALVSLEVTDLS
jgi:hypothetical protein